MAAIPDEPVVSGPFLLYDGSFVIEFLRPDVSRNATVLIRATWKHDNPAVRAEKGHPGCPPLHLHFEQSETFSVIQGTVRVTTGYALTDQIITPADGSHEIKPWVPHTFSPVAGVGEDTIFLMWAHPGGTSEAMDEIFFRSLTMYVSDVSDKKVAMNPLQVILTSHVSATAMVWWPTVSWLGPLRWWVPLKIFGAFALIARLVGLEPVIERYTDRQDWEMYRSGKWRK